MKQITIFLVLIILGLSLTVPVSAAKKRVKAAANKSGTASISYSTAKLNRATHSVDLYFQNLSGVSKIKYELSYDAKGIAQGAMGSITPGSSSDSRNLYFGTCSKGVCTPHSNITGATLSVQMQLKSGGSYTKLYRIKI
jgi:hypothetical protein